MLAMAVSNISVYVHSINSNQNEKDAYYLFPISNWSNFKILYPLNLSDTLFRLSDFAFRINQIAKFYVIEK